MRRLDRLAASAVTVLAAALSAQGAARQEFEKVRTRALAENGQRHLQLGAWAREQGLVPQATAEFLLAVEVAEGQNPGAVQVLGTMRALDERFWKDRKKRPSKALLDEFERRARVALREDRQARWRVAREAHARKLEAEALREFRALVGAVDEALEVDKQGRIVLDEGVVPAEVSARILAAAVTIDAQRYAPDEPLLGLPDAARIHERASRELRVRGTLPAERIADLHALGLALFPQLEKQLDGRPVRRVCVFVFGTRAEYAAYLAANALQRFERASGFADYGPQQAIVCAEGCDEAGLRGLFVHELVHLYDYQIAPAALPSWYIEAFAESFGADGGFTWQGGKLELTGRMTAAARQQLAASVADFSLRELLDGDVGALWAADAEKARRFYVQARGVLEFLRTGAGDGVAQRFAAWEAMCRGKALGADPNSKREQRRRPDAAEARRLFDDMFGSELLALQRDFLAWARDGG